MYDTDHPFLVSYTGMLALVTVLILILMVDESPVFANAPREGMVVIATVLTQSAFICLWWVFAGFTNLTAAETFLTDRSKYTIQAIFFVLIHLNLVRPAFNRYGAGISEFQLIVGLAFSLVGLLNIPAVTDAIEDFATSIASGVDD